MKEIVIISGKGGTGKTSLTAAFAALSRNAVFADCDVDAADLHLILRPEVVEERAFKSGNEARIQPELCSGCGICSSVCRFGALRKKCDALGRIAYTVEPFACEGCGLCVRLCPEQAILFPERTCGTLFISSTRFGPLVHARLTAAAENSGKLVSLVRKEAKRVAEEEGRAFVLIDGPPGIGCPVIASVTGADRVLVVAEPTLSGEHDLLRVMELTRHFGIRTLVCINKADINEDAAARIEKLASERGAGILGRIPYDEEVTAAQVRGLTLGEHGKGKTLARVRAVWERLIQHEAE